MKEVDNNLSQELTVLSINKPVEKSVEQKVIEEKDVEETSVEVSVEEEFEEGKFYDEIDEDTGRVISGEELGKVGGRYDMADEAEDSRITEREDRIERQALLKEALDFVKARFEFLVADQNIEVHRLYMRDPFVVSVDMASRFINLEVKCPVLEKPNVATPAFINMSSASDATREFYDEEDD